MPFASAVPRVSSAVISTLGRVAGALLWTAVVLIGLFAVLLLAVRLVVFPNIERYRDTIVRAIAAQVKQPIEIETLATGWNGWNPKLVINGFRMGTRSADGPAALLELPRVELTVAWTSLAVRDLRLNQLVMESPRLAIRRDANGVIHLAGIEIDPEDRTDDSTVTDWLLRQREILVRDALITWTDERRNAPQLVLDKVNFRLASSFARRHFGLTGSPPAELAGPIDLRGDFVAASLHDWKRADGRLYARLDYADIAAWREWLPLPVDLTHGKGALRAWFDFVDGQPREVIADVEMAGVQTRLQPELPELALAHVRGRAGWRLERDRREVFCRDLAFTTAPGVRVAPMNLSLLMHMDDKGTPQGGRIEFDRLDLAPLRDLAEHLPLPQDWRTKVQAGRPQGVVSRGLVQWRGPAEAPTDYDVAGEFTGFGVVAHRNWPGAANVSGKLKANTKGGELRLDTRAARLDLPRYFVQPLALDTIQGGIAWTIAADRVTARIDDLAFANGDAAGKVRATYRSAASGPGEIDLDGSLSRANAQALPRYLPIFLSEGFRNWLANAIKPGVVDEARVKLKGDLKEFPFTDERKGVFTVDVKGRDFGLRYADDWPAIAEIDGDLHFRGSGMRIDAARGRVFGVVIGATSATIPDLRNAVLQVDGQATGPTPDFLRFMEESPVGEWTGHFTRGASASGEGRLALKLSLPMGDPSANRVAGEFTFQNDQLQFVGVPPLAQVNGRVTFTNRELRGRDITAEALGGPVRIGLGTTEGRIRIAASGTANIQAVRREFDLPFANRLSGSADWTFALDTRGDATSWVVESPLKGLAIDLPRPLRKSASETLAMRIERPQLQGSPEDMLTATLGDVAHVSAHRRLDGAVPRIDRAVVSLGRAPRQPDARGVRSGLWVRAVVPDLDVDQWLATTDAEPASGAAAVNDLRLAGVDIEAQDLVALGHQFTAVKVNGRRVQDQWRLDLAGHEVAGSATWSGPSEKAPNGLVVARLGRLSPPRDAGATSAPAQSADHGASHWPELDIAADSFVSKGRDLGRLELSARPRSGEWRIERLLLANDSGRVEASGAWKAGARPDRTQLDVVLDVKEAGSFLARFGFPGAVQGAPTKITGQLAWTGDPSDFDYPSLSGAFHIDVGSGRFLKVDPGIGKLLGVLSLQALPRRISLDFRDVFSEGFTFDRVSGNVRVAQGVLASDDLRLTGPSAQVAIAGEADLAKETQRLRVRVQPTLSAGVSAGAALLFLGNPVLGAAVGAGSLLAQKVLRDPIEQIFSYEYSISGSWSDPQVTRGATATAAMPQPSTVK